MINHELEQLQKSYNDLLKSINSNKAILSNNARKIEDLGDIIYNLVEENKQIVNSKLDYFLFIVSSIIISLIAIIVSCNLIFHFGLLVLFGILGLWFIVTRKFYKQIKKEISKTGIKIRENKEQIAKNSQYSFELHERQIILSKKIFDEKARLNELIKLINEYKTISVDINDIELEGNKVKIKTK